ncbi:MAG: NAD-dependent epimerase/dehydratase family protein [Rhodospirillaceae bacterium]|nr:NAD-dependent epimerase/dehydratase family protein [Rhodospirillaceae bacterium]MBT5941409.1 NAD-dependent epimerase/dehydratase family protein [Rhodospirillaceae bacterium]MBT7267935.1 NAD-dependent epimerase/dehydratase family protein [Rhodospirillaceae bacterium]
MKILLTGATGFVGAAVLRQLLEHGDQVRVLIREQSDRRNLAGLDCEICIGDLDDKASLERALEGCQALFHVAADYRIWARRPEEMTATNLTGTRMIMTAALDAGIERIVYTSSVATLGINGDATPADEKTPSSLDTMIGVYKRSKFLAEEEIKRLIVERSLPAIIVNPSAPIGPRDIKPTPTGRMIVQAARGEMPAHVDTGLNVVHVDDVARGHILAFDKGVIGERYILGGEDLSLKQILELVAEVTGKPAPKICIPHNVVLPIAYLAEAWAKLTHGAEPFATVDGVNMARKKMYFSSAKAQKELGYTHRPPIDAIRDAIKWFGEQGYLD